MYKYLKYGTHAPSFTDVPQTLRVVGRNQTISLGLARIEQLVLCSRAVSDRFDWMAAAASRHLYPIRSLTGPLESSLYKVTDPIPTFCQWQTFHHASQVGSSRESAI